MSGNFVTEADLEEARKNRQAEWERVRKPDDPEEAPEETYDHRSLFERLEEHKRVKVNIQLLFCPQLILCLPYCPAGIMASL